MRSVISGRSVWDREVEGSNPLAPTIELTVVFTNPQFLLFPISLTLAKQGGLSDVEGEFPADEPRLLTVIPRFQDLANPSQRANSNYTDGYICPNLNGFPWDA